MFIFVAAVGVLALQCSAAYYIPGVLPAGYLPGQVLAIRVNSLTSNQGVMPFPFYSVKTCMPSKDRLKKERKHENLGEVLWGDQIEPSDYYIEVLKNISCRKVCDPLSYDKKEMEVLKKRVEQQYRGNMVLDNLPVAQHIFAGPRHPEVMIGYPMGVPAKISPIKMPLVNNHLHFRIGYNEPDIHDEKNEETFRIVGFYVSAHSADLRGKADECSVDKDFNPDNYPVLTTDADQITWTYSVSWIEEPDVLWGTRWDVYLRGGKNDNKIHWMSIINSLLIMVFLSGLVAMIMMRVLHKDYNRYNDPDENEAQEEVGWKMVHGDVFRPPSKPILLAAVVGSGSQVALMCAITLVFACMGFLSPSNRGALLTAVILSYVLVGSIAGYLSARLLKFFKRQAWKNVFLTGMLVPGTGMLLYMMLNLVQWAKHASSAVPITTLLLLFALWFCCSLPLVIVGAAIGFKRPVMEMPCKANVMPRIIPEQKWFLQNAVVVAACGILPFGACFIELVYILSSFWQGRAYYVFGFLAVVFLILCVTCMQVSVVMTYFQLCYEDYHWWWRSFNICASGGVYLFGFTIYYLATVLTIRQGTSMVLYVGYMFLMSSLFSIVTGSIGFYSAFWFVGKIYANIKVD